MNMEKGFYWTSRAYYAKALPRLDEKYDDEIMIGRLSEHDGCEYEFAIRWVALGGKSVPYLEMFQDAFLAINDMPELMQALAALHETYPQPQEIFDLLIGLGYKDFTKYKR